MGFEGRVAVSRIGEGFERKKNGDSRGLVGPWEKRQPSAR